MKKVLIAFLTFILISFNSFVAFAASVSNSNIGVTSGLDFSEEAKSTFDKSRTITGKAKEGSIINITVSEKLLEKEEKLKEIEKYEIVVGASGYFSQNINLTIGENIIDINIKDKQKNIYNEKATITRKKSEIKNELEQAIILPRTRK